MLYSGTIKENNIPYRAKMLNVKRLKENDFSHFIHSLYDEGWLVEELYLKFLYNEFQNDFFIASLKNEVVGFISAIKKKQDLGIISNFIIMKKFRSRGFGKQLFSHALQHLNNRQITLECTSKQESFYIPFGFSTYYDSIFYVYTTHTTFAKNKSVSSFFDKEKISLSKEIACIQEDVSTLFRAIYHTNKLSSYGVCTPYNDGYKIIISSLSEEEALALFLALLNPLEIGTKIYIEVSPLELPQLNVVKVLKMTEFSRIHKMYNKVLHS